MSYVDMDIDKEFSSVDVLDKEVSVLLDVTDSVMRFGVTKTSFSLLKSYNLLSSVALEALSSETADVYGEDANDLALEDLTESVKEKMSQWSAKVLSVISKSSGFIVSMVSKVWDSIKSIVERIKDKTVDTTKAATATIKAHPYASIATMLAAATAVLGIVVGIKGGFPPIGATKDTLTKFISTIGNKIKSIRIPGSPITTTYTVDGKVLKATVETSKLVPGEGSLGVLGWSKSKITTVAAQVGRLVSSTISTVKDTGSFFITTTKKFFKLGDKIDDMTKGAVAKKTGSRVVGWVSGKIANSMYFSVLFNLVGTLFGLIKAIVIKTVQMVKQAFSALAHVFV